MKPPNRSRFVEQVDVDRLLRNRDRQPIRQVHPPGGQLLQQPMTGSQRELAVDDQLLADHRVAGRERQPRRGELDTSGDQVPIRMTGSMAFRAGFIVSRHSPVGGAPRSLSRHAWRRCTASSAPLAARRAALATTSANSGPDGHAEPPLDHPPPGRAIRASSSGRRPAGRWPRPTRPAWRPAIRSGRR